MHEAFVLIVVNAIRERYVSEKAFYTEELGISGQSWTRWKNGERGLKAENLQKIARLFTDYEWMLANKVARNADVLQKSLQTQSLNIYGFEGGDCEVADSSRKCPCGLEDGCFSKGKFKGKCNDFTCGNDIWSLELPRYY